MGEAFYGRAQAYRAALGAPGERSAGRDFDAQYLWRDAPARLRRRALRPICGRRYVVEAQRPDAVSGRPNCASRTQLLLLRIRMRLKKTEMHGQKPKPWSVPVGLDDIPETGLHIEIDAPEAQRVPRWPHSPDVRELPRLSAVFDLARRGAGRHVTGQVSARVGQTCVVTLEPIESDLRRAGRSRVCVRRRCGACRKLTTERRRRDRRNRSSAARWILGAIATEFLILGIDPYPRKPECRIRAAQERRWRRATVCCAWKR